MKRITCLLQTLVVCVLISCDVMGPSNEELVRERTNELFGFITSRQIDSVKVIYPEFNETYMDIDTDSIRILKVTQGMSDDSYDVEITNFFSIDHMPDLMVKRNIILTFEKAPDDYYYVKKSVGFLNTDKMPYEAKETGYLKERANDSDVDIIKGLGVLDTIRQEIIDARYDYVKQNINVELWYGRGKNFYRVSNYSNEDIKRVSFRGTFTYETYPNDEFHNEGVVSNLRSNYYKDVTFYEDEFTDKRIEQGTYFYTTTLVTGYHLKSYEITNIELANEIIYDGDEYANYKKSHSKGS